MKLEQCLFGYEDGHRLLASSIPLGDQVSSLTELSDLAPGAVFGRSNGYWTGVPVPGIGRYALMRTWPAPEMSRPGCVWTHALLLEPSTLGEMPDLAALVALACRPDGPADRARYREPLAMEPHTTSPNRPSLNGGLVRRLLCTLYDGASPAIEVPAPGDADAWVFAIWSQQWPRLRRNLRFQTAVTREPRAPTTTRFDITLQFDGPDSSVDGADDTETWIEAAVDDLAQGTAGALRSFLWRYGEDVTRQRGSFRPLVEIKLLHDDGQEDAGSRLLELITRAFPGRADAGRLKQDVVDGVLVPSAQLDVLWFVLAHGGDAVIPPPTKVGVARLARLWPKRPQDLLLLAESTADAADHLGMLVFETLTDAVPLQEFWSLTISYPRMRERMVMTRPELMASDGIAMLDDATLASLIALVPPGASVADELVPRLLSRDDTRLADMTIDRFPQIVASYVVSATDGGSVPVGRTWVRRLVCRPSVLLDPVVMSRITRASLLYDLGEALRWLTPEVVAEGTKPWIAALDVTNDLPDDRRDTLYAFLIALALASGGEGGRHLLEKFFDAVHGQALKSRLPWRARDILSPLLPDLGWGRGWDFGLRLRLAVAATYVRNGYPPESYARLARARKARDMLADAATDVPGGKPLAKAAAG